MNTRRTSTLLLTIAFLLTACGQAGDSGEQVVSTQPVDTSEKYGEERHQSPGKPSPPLRIRYEVEGAPVVGQPVAVNVFVTSSEEVGEVQVRYRVTDPSSMNFPDSQATRLEMRVGPGDDTKGLRQITVIPQREGRLFLNVSAEVQTPQGSMLRTQAIPIQVGAAPKNKLSDWIKNEL